MIKKISLNDVFLLDENPRFKINAESKKRIKEITFSDLNKDYQKKAAKKLFSFEGNFKDFYDLINSIYQKKFREKNNYLFFLEKTSNNQKKYLTTDGNRRLLALLLLTKTINITEIIDKSKLELTHKKYINKIEEILKNSFEFKFFEYSSIYNLNEIEEMFEEINFRHTGQGNGKRKWSRAKMLKEIYNIYIKNNHDFKNSIIEIVNSLGVSQSKAQSDIPSAIWFMDLFLEFKKNNSKYEKFDENLVSPSAVELVKSLKLPEGIIEHYKNKNKEDTIAKLFNIKYKKNDYFINQEELKLINFKGLAELIIGGYFINNKKLEYNDEEKDNEIHQGLKKNAYFSTRGWSDLGIEKLLEILEWPDGVLINQKISQIKKNKRKIFLLKKEEIKELINTNSFQEKDIVKSLKNLLETKPINFEKSIKYTKTGNHIYDVITIIMNNEYARLKKMDRNKNGFNYLLQENDLISQLSVFRTLYETLTKLIYYICIDFLSGCKNLDVEKNYIINESLVKNKKDDFDYYLVTKKLFNKSDYNDLKNVFNEMRHGVKEANFFIHYNKVFNAVSEYINYQKNQDKKKIIIEIKKYIDEFNKIKKLIGPYISMPLHQFDKFINKNDLESLSILNKKFSYLFEIFEKMRTIINENKQFLFKDNEITFE